MSQDPYAFGNQPPEGYPVAPGGFGPPAGWYPPDLEMREPGIPAERSTRWFARLLDHLLFLVAALPGFFWLMIMSSNHAPEARAAMSNGLALLPLLLGVLAMAALQSYLVTTRGQSIAKGWLGLCVVKTDGSPPGGAFAVRQNGGGRSVEIGPG